MMSTDIGELFRGILAEEDVARDGDLSSYAVDGLVPQVALFPRDVEGVSRILAAAHLEGLKVAPRGGGTKMVLGNPPRGLDAVVSLARLDQVLEHQPGELTATVQGGITLEALRQALEQEGQFFPLDSPLFAQATLGGTLACNVSGPRRLAYGTARDLLIGVRVVHADGTVTKAGGKVIKNVTGYDLNKLYVGSLGTLGIIVEASLKLAPLPPMERTLLGLFPSIQEAVETSWEILKKGLEPLAICLLDATAIQHLRDFDLTLSDKQMLLAVELGGRRASVESRESQVSDLFHQHTPSPVAALNMMEGRRLWRAIGDMGWGQDPAALVLRYGVLSTQIPDLCDILDEAYERNGMALGVVAQAGSGIVHALAWSQEDVPPPQEMVSLISRLRQRVLSLGSYGVVERCPTTVKASLDVWGDPGEGIGIMRRLKEKFDPNGVLNPGRFVGGI